MAVSWASSCVFACVNTQRRAHARGLATEYLAWKRVAALDAVVASDELKAQATEQRTEAGRRLKKAIREAYQHVLYLGEDGSGGREIRTIRLQKENQSALDGQIVWAALADEDKAFGVGEFDAKALIHNLRDQDWVGLSMRSATGFGMPLAFPSCPTAKPTCGTRFTRPSRVAILSS